MALYFNKINPKPTPRKSTRISTVGAGLNVNVNMWNYTGVMVYDAWETGTDGQDDSSIHTPTPPTPGNKNSSWKFALKANIWRMKILIICSRMNEWMMMMMMMTIILHWFRPGGSDNECATSHFLIFLPRGGKCILQAAEEILANASWVFY